jgi:hypothetical protein
MDDVRLSPTTPETVRRTAEEVVGLKLNADQAAALADTLKDLLREISACMPATARGGFEPDVLPVLEEWPR